MKRNPFNTNQFVHDGPKFKGLDVLSGRGKLIATNLQRTHDCFLRSLEKYGRVCVIRFDLYVPDSYSRDALGDNNLIGDFISSLRARINYSQQKSKESGSRVHETDVDYLWCREISGEGRVHYHVAILLNYHAYAFIGQFRLCSNNMYARIHKS